MPKYKKSILNEPAINITKDHEIILKGMQANILRHHKKRWSKHIFIRFYNDDILNQKREEWQKTQYRNSSLKKARAFLATITLTSAHQQMTEGNTDSPITCMYISHKGFKFLEQLNLVPSSTAFENNLAEDIKEGFNLDETETSIANAHAMILVAADPDPINVENVNNKDILNQEVANLESKLGHTNCEIILRQDGELTTSSSGSKKIYKELFGYVDGISNSRFFPKSKMNSSSIPLSSIASLKTVLIPDLDASSFGSYLVFLKLEQDIQAFERLYENIAKRIFDIPVGVTVSTDQKNEAKALIMGRYPKGAPIMKKSKKDDYNFDNEFDYKELVSNGHSWSKDDKGIGCPFFSHIRKANSRDNKNNYSNHSKIIRRGVNYKDEKVGTTIPKGLLFMSFQRDIQEQFETLITSMLHNPYTDGVYTGSDILTGKTDQIRIHSGNPKDIPINPAKVLAEVDSTGKDLAGRNLVTLKGGAYFFAPSISYFRNNINFYPPLIFDGDYTGEDFKVITPLVKLIDEVPQRTVDEIKNIYLKPIRFSDIRDDRLKQILNVEILEAER